MVISIEALVRPSDQCFRLFLADLEFRLLDASRAPAYSVVRHQTLVERLESETRPIHLSVGGRTSNVLAKRSDSGDATGRETYWKRLFQGLKRRIHR